MKKSIDGSGNVNEEGGRYQDDQGRNGVNGRFATAGEHTEADLDDVDHGEHEEEAAHDGADGGAEHAEAEDLEVDVGAEGLVDVLAVEEVDGQLQALSHQGREEEEAERNHLEHQQLLRHVDPRVARPVLQALLPRRRQRQPHEHRYREQRVHVHQPVQRRHVHARRRRRR